MKNMTKISIATMLALGFSYANSAVLPDDAGGEVDLFSVFDLDHDNRISMEEMTVAAFNMIKSDRDGDHYLTRDELTATEDYRHFMAMFDFNKDNKLTMEEIPARLRAKLIAIKIIIYHKMVKILGSL